MKFSTLARIAAVMAIGCSLVACATVPSGLKNAWDVVTSASVPPSLVLVAGNTFDGLEATATQYLRKARCTGSNGPVCRSPAATKVIIPAVRSGRVARNNLEQFLADHPGELGPKGDYDALVAANATLQGAIAQFKIGR